MLQMHELVDDDIVDQTHRGLDDAPVQADGAAPIAAAPALLLIRDDDTRHRDTGFRSPRRHPLRQTLRGVVPEPGDDGIADLSRLPGSGRRGHVEPPRAELGVSDLVRMDL